MTHVQPKRSPDDLCRELARSQYGLVTRKQALESGLLPAAIKRRVRSGSWESAIGRAGAVLDLGCSSIPPTELDADLPPAEWGRVGSLSGCSSWFPGFSFGEIEVVTLCALSRPLKGVTAHRTNYLPPEDVTAIGGLPVTTPARTLLDLGGLVSSKLVARAAADALSRNKMTQPLLQDQLRRAGARGRPGTAALRELLEQLEDRRVPQAFMAD